MTKYHSFLQRKKMAYPSFTLGGSLHNKEEFSGRYFHFLSVINPASLIKSEADIRAAEGLLLRSRNEARGGVVKGELQSSVTELLQTKAHLSFFRECFLLRIYEQGNVGRADAGSKCSPSRHRRNHPETVSNVWICSF